MQTESCTWRLFSAGILFFLITILLSTSYLYAATGNEIIYSDEPEYTQGDIVTIYGEGFDPDKNIIVEVERADGSIVTGDGTNTPGSDIVTTDSSGNFIYTYILDGGPDEVYEGTFNVNAIDTVTMTVLATTSFLDNPKFLLQGCSREKGDCTEDDPATGWADGVGPMNGWTSGNLKGWYELEDVPYRLRTQLRKSGDAGTYYIMNEHDNERISVTGIDSASGFYVGAGPGVPGLAEGELTKLCTTLPGGTSLPSLPYNVGGTDYDCVVMGPTFSDVDDDGDLSVDEDAVGGGDPAPIGSTSVARWIQYTWVVRFDSTEAGSSDKKWALYWLAHLASGSSAYPGAALHSKTSATGSQDVPINNVLAITTYTLSVSKTGTGSGTVTSSPGGINCGSDCSEPYSYGTPVTLTAAADAGSVFAGWSGDPDCSDGVVTVDSAKSCTATFNLQTNTLSVSKTGTGSGTVTSSPAGINCGIDCSEPYSYGTPVTLTATADAGSVFAGWSGGGCSGSGTCVVTMDAAKSVTATFDIIPSGDADLSITKTDSPEPVAEVGLNLTYTITVKNNGPGTAYGVTVTDTLPSTSEVSLVSFSTTQGSCSGATTITCDIGTLAQDATATITIVVQTLIETILSNTASVTSSVFDPDLANNSATQNTNVGDLSRLIAISTRAYVNTGNNAAIGGIIFGGNLAKTILFRGRGPSMAGKPFNITGTMGNPYLELYKKVGSSWVLIATNDNWQDTPDPLCQTSGYVCGGATEIIATDKDPCRPNPGQSTAPLGCTNESAILINIPPGNYTAILKGVSGETGVGLVEVFDPDTITKPKLGGISTRARVLTGDSAMIGGYIIAAGSSSKKVLIRGRGPSMGGAPFNIPDTLSNPYLSLYKKVGSSWVLISTNDNWQDTPDPLCQTSGYVCGGATEISTTGKDPCKPNPGQSTAPSGCTNESAILATLPPGNYTAILKGVNGVTGVGLVEIFEIE